MAEQITLVDAVNMALAYELSHNPDVVVLGEDIGLNGGVFRATQNLQKQFGKELIVSRMRYQSDF